MKGEKKEIIISEAEAIEKINQWAYQLEVDASTEAFQDVIDTLKFPVRMGRIDFDSENSVFRVQLLSPIVKNDGSKIEIVTVRELSMGDKIAYDRYKENQPVKQALELLSRACDLEIGFADRLKDRDTTRINAIILGFFVQIRRT